MQKTKINHVFILNSNKMYVVFTTAYIILVGLFSILLLLEEDYTLLYMVLATIAVMGAGVLMHLKLGLTNVAKILSFLVLHIMIALAYLVYNYGPVSFLSVILALLPVYSILVTERSVHKPLQILGLFYSLGLYLAWGYENYHSFSLFISNSTALYITLMASFLGVTLSLHLDAILLILEKQNEELIRTHKKLGVFLSDVSHQIKTPLNGILGIQNLLDSAELGEDKNELYEILKHSSMSMMRDMNNVMELSKIEGDLVHIYSEYFKFDEILEDAQFMYEENVFNKRQVIHYEPNNLIFLGDKSKVKLIIENILDNIFAHNRESEVFFELDIMDTLRIKIIDPSTGNHTKIEKQEFNDKDDLSRNSSSLGLYMAKKLATLLGGSLDLFENDEATNYMVELPYPPLRDSEVQRRTHEPKDKIENVLLVEDNAISRKIIAAHFQNRNYNITTTVNGLEALEYIKNNYNTVDVIFMDIQMPVMDGITATKKIRDWEYKHSNHTKPIIALTANTMFEDKLMCYSSGISYFIGKPFNPKKIELLLQKIEASKTA